jgi:hypothetical protein
MACFRITRKTSGIRRNGCYNWLLGHEHSVEHTSNFSNIVVAERGWSCVEVTFRLTAQELVVHKQRGFHFSLTRGCGQAITSISWPAYHDGDTSSKC